jgi:adenylate cyclase
MVEQVTTELAIVFSDICGSTRLYESLGDTQARSIVAQCFAEMERIIKSRNGALIKAIGDEILCTFDSAEASAKSAIEFQELMADGFFGEDLEFPVDLQIKVGFQLGPAIREGGDVFGDAVNVAARMVGFAKGGQIITTKDTADSLPPMLRDTTRHLDTTTVKGKSQEIDIYEVVWQEDESTRTWSGLFDTSMIQTRLRVRYRDEERVLTLDTPPFIMGRGRNANLAVHEEMVSREHARIEVKRGKFVLLDTSTNGTYATVDEKTVWLRREEVALGTTGFISLGKQIGKDTTVVIQYECENVAGDSESLQSTGNPADPA